MDGWEYVKRAFGSREFFWRQVNALLSSKWGLINIQQVLEPLSDMLSGRFTWERERAAYANNAVGTDTMFQLSVSAIFSTRNWRTSGQRRQRLKVWWMFRRYEIRWAAWELEVGYRWTERGTMGSFCTIPIINEALENLRRALTQSISHTVCRQLWPAIVGDCDRAANYSKIQIFSAFSQHEASSTATMLVICGRRACLNTIVTETKEREFTWQRRDLSFNS